MSEELQKKLIEWIEQLKAGAETQLPDIATQWMKYELISSYLLIATSAVLILIGLSVLIWSIVKYDDMELYFATGFVSVFVLIVFSMVMACNIGNVIKIKTAPKIFIIQKITNLAQGKCK